VRLIYFYHASKTIEDFAPRPSRTLPTRSDIAAVRPCHAGSQVLN
jgi:hypothetical protein